MRRAVVVDDDPAVARLVSLWLAEKGWVVERVQDVAAAREAVRSREPDLVVLDFVLPDGDGLVLLREWRAKGIVMPVIALTGAESETIVESLLRAGAHDVASKGSLERESFLRAVDATAEPSPLSPKAPAPRGPAEMDPEEAPPLPPGRALIVDDVPVMRRLLRSLLEPEGWKVEEATTAVEAVRLAATSEYDVILLDYLLPDVDGAGVLRDLRRRGVRAPVVIVTAHGAEEVATEFALAGAADFIAKETLTRARLVQAIHAARASRVDVRAR